MFRTESLEQFPFIPLCHISGVQDYNPSTGRFLSEDPQGFGGEDFNLFRYTVNNSINSSDPTGELTLAEIGVLAGVLAVGIVVQKCVYDARVEKAKELSEKAKKRDAELRKQGKSITPGTESKPMNTGGKFKEIGLPKRSKSRKITPKVRNY